MQVLLDNGFVSSYALVGTLVEGIEVPEPEDIEHFETHFTAYRLRDGTLQFDEGQNTENERKAISVFQNYIYGKQGFPGSNMDAQFAGRARVINLKCSGCGADLEINAGRTETFCPYCGSKQIIMH